MWERSNFSFFFLGFFTILRYCMNQFARNSTNAQNFSAKIVTLSSVVPYVLQWYWFSALTKVYAFRVFSSLFVRLLLEIVSIILFSVLNYYTVSTLSSSFFVLYNLFIFLLHRFLMVNKENGIAHKPFLMLSWWS